MAKRDFLVRRRLHQFVGRSFTDEPIHEFFSLRVQYPVRGEDKGDNTGRRDSRVGIRVDLNLFFIFLIEVSEASVAIVGGGLYLNEVDDPRPHRVIEHP